MVSWIVDSHIMLKPHPCLSPHLRVQNHDDDDDDEEEEGGGGFILL